METEQMPTEQTPTKLLNVRQVSELTGLGTSTIWRDAKRGVFPAPKKIGERKTVWTNHQVEGWIREKLSNAS